MLTFKNEKLKANICLGTQKKKKITIYREKKYM